MARTIARCVRTGRVANAGDQPFFSTAYGNVRYTNLAFEGGVKYHDGRMVLPPLATTARIHAAFDRSTVYRPAGASSSSGYVSNLLGKVNGFVGSQARHYTKANWYIEAVGRWGMSPAVVEGSGHGQTAQRMAQLVCRSLCFRDVADGTVEMQQPAANKRPRTEAARTGAGGRAGPADVAMGANRDAGIPAGTRLRRRRTLFTHVLRERGEEQEQEQWRRRLEEERAGGTAGAAWSRVRTRGQLEVAQVGPEAVEGEAAARLSERGPYYYPSCSAVKEHAVDLLCDPDVQKTLLGGRADHVVLPSDRRGWAIHVKRSLLTPTERKSHWAVDGLNGITAIRPIGRKGNKRVCAFVPE